MQAQKRAKNEGLNRRSKHKHAAYTRYVVASEIWVSYGPFVVAGIFFILNVHVRFDVLSLFGI